ncbi:hypothetical protein SAMN05518672_1148 [Chitinophaga sp. CF118]|uniref:hypothetical protein n=1 Tax=Chitinophaga sp. CF118 TaxID=1884367 RepID=UPI0008E85D03|nr:hypothetical protein [Chitinophaga sp. CF118]SFF00464.1 hypothetical protein SAMN05518672_1148 [Chitinophaga sp. CF118]
MKTLEELEEDIRELLILNNRDVNIHNYPDLISNARELGFDTGALAVLVSEVYGKTDWRAYDRIYEQLNASETVARGAFFDKDAKQIIESVKNDLPAQKVIPYIISIISKEPYNFEPRDLTPPDWSSFRNFWMHDEAWQRYQQQVEPVYWCDVKATTLEQIGEISFRKKEEAMEYLENKLYLPPLVTLLTRNVSRTKSFERIFEEEKDLEKRYLTIIYRLNNNLPFRFHGKTYNTVAELLNDGCDSHELFLQMEALYGKGHMHIWLKEVNAEQEKFLTEQNDKNGFLTFLYKVNNQYPYYLNGKRYNSPVQLTEAAKNTGVVWPEIFSAINAGHLQTWFAGLNNQHWNDQLVHGISTITSSGFYSEEEHKLATVQTLINLVDPASPIPSVKAVPESLSFLNTEASKPVEQVIQLRLAGSGFVKVKVQLDEEFEGVSIDKEFIKFYSLVDNNTGEIKLRIQPMMLVKDRIYNVNIVVTSIYEQVHIPVTISVTFPKRAYILEMMKFSAIGALFFMLIISIAPVLYNYPDDVNYFSQDTSISDLPPGFLGFLFTFLLLISGLWYSYRFIKQKYKTNVND